MPDLIDGGVFELFNVASRLSSPVRLSSLVSLVV